MTKLKELENRIKALEKTFDKLKIAMELSETEIFSITIDSDDIEDYEDENIDIGEFKSRWEFS